MISFSIQATKQTFKASWSNWSEWSPCHGVNRRCDSGRIHSRIRKCIAENGDVVNSDFCRMNNGEQQELEIRDCRCDSLTSGNDSALSSGSISKLAHSKNDFNNQHNNNSNNNNNNNNNNTASIQSKATETLNSDDEHDGKPNNVINKLKVNNSEWIKSISHLSDFLYQVHHLTLQ